MTRSSGRVGLAAVTMAMVFAVAAPAFSLATVEPTLGECRAFVAENGVPETRPVWEGRGYSGWDVCLNMAYDGDLEGSFASADMDGDGRLGVAEQASYMDSVIGPVSDPDQSPLTLEKCASLVSEHGIPAERPFVDWSNRGYGDAEICQSLAFDGTLAASFASADSNADGRLDRAEQSSYIASLASSPNEAAPQPGSAANGAPTSEPQTESIAHEQDGANAAEEQYGNAEGAGDESAGESTSMPVEPIISAVSDGAATEEPSDPTDPTDSTDSGVLIAVNDAVRGLLPDTGGIPVSGVLVGLALVAGGLLTYRLQR